MSSELEKKVSESFILHILISNVVLKFYLGTVFKGMMPTSWQDSRIVTWNLKNNIQNNIRDMSSDSVLLLPFVSYPDRASNFIGTNTGSLCKCTETHQTQVLIEIIRILIISLHTRLILKLSQMQMIASYYGGRI